MTECWGICALRNDADVAYDVVTHHALEGLSGIVTVDNHSDDDTAAELYRCQQDLIGICQVEVMHDAAPVFGYDSVMTGAAEHAAGLGATWIVPFDADELWYDPSGEPLAVTLIESPADVITAHVITHVETGDDVLDEVSPFQRMVWHLRALNADAIPKVAFRWRPGARIHHGAHGVMMPGPEPVEATEWLMIRHFRYRSLTQFKSKVRDGVISGGFGPDITTFWKTLNEMDGFELNRFYIDHFYHHLPAADGLIRDPAPLRRLR